MVHRVHAPANDGVLIEITDFGVRILVIGVEIAIRLRMRSKRPLARKLVVLKFQEPSWLITRAALPPVFKG
jgi:hypothetical protein